MCECVREYVCVFVHEWICRVRVCAYLCVSGCVGQLRILQLSNLFWVKFVQVIRVIRVIRLVVSNSCLSYVIGAVRQLVGITMSNWSCHVAIRNKRSFSQQS